MLRDLIQQNRSFRRFDESARIDPAALRDLVDLARHSASGSNLQPLKYMLITEPDRTAQVFPHLGWAGFLTNWPGPAEGERPAAYIVMMTDETIKKNADKDVGIAAQSMMLGASEQGLGGCMVGSIKDMAALREALGVPDHLHIQLILALGKPAETVVLDPLGEDGSIKYWRDENDVHHVPKRSLDEIILG